MRRALILMLVVGSAAGAVRVQVDVSKTPNAQPYVGPVTELFRTWYPKIGAVLFGGGAALPFQEVRVVFEPGIIGDDDAPVPAYTTGNAVHVSFAYIGVMPDDYRAMLIHELTHVNQHYHSYSPGDGWLVEGIADYVRHKYFEKDIEPRLRLDTDGNLEGYDKARLQGEGYAFGYTVASPFLFWLEQRKDRNIVMVLNKALREGEYSRRIFEERCGAPLPALWREFMAQSRQ